MEIPQAYSFKLTFSSCPSGRGGVLQAGTTALPCLRNMYHAPSVFDVLPVESSGWEER
jgi:hypothetical protein